MSQEFTKFIEKNMAFLTSQEIQEFIKSYKIMETLISQYYNAINETEAKKKTETLYSTQNIMNISSIVTSSVD